jgi:predicted Ser/Thr protein kinase
MIAKLGMDGNVSFAAKSVMKIMGNAQTLIVILGIYRKAVCDMERDLSEYLDKIDLATRYAEQQIEDIEDAYTDGYVDGYKQAVDEFAEQLKKGGVE